MEADHVAVITPTKLPYENAFSYGNENRRRNSRPRTDTAGHLSVRKLPGEDLRHVLYTIANFPVILPPAGAFAYKMSIYAVKHRFCASNTQHPGASRMSR